MVLKPNESKMFIENQKRTLTEEEKEIARESSPATQWFKQMERYSSEQEDKENKLIEQSRLLSEAMEERKALQDEIVRLRDHIAKIEGIG